MDALAFIAKPPAAVGPLYVLHGDEAFLKQQAIQLLRAKALGPDADAQAVATYAGDQAQFADVFDELSTAGFFFPRRFIVIENADPFVSRHRALLEKHVGAMPSTGTLVLDVKTWAANTRLAKLVSDTATLVCKAPAAYRLPPWCTAWAQSQCQKHLPQSAATLLVDLVGSEMGLLHQEILKLANYVGKRETIEPADVDLLVGQSREESVWKIFDAVAAGRADQALQLLDRLLEQGEEPMRLIGALAAQLRKLAQAARLALAGMPLPGALAKAGILPFAIQSAEQQMKHLGRRRLLKVYDWLLELQQDLRGGSALAERTLLERLVVRLARKSPALAK